MANIPLKTDDAAPKTGPPTEAVDSGKLLTANGGILVPSIAQAGATVTVSSMLVAPSQAIMAAAPVVSSSSGPVLVVPQPFPQFMQFYRPQFATTAAVATSGNTNPAAALAPSGTSEEPGVLDLSKSAKLASPSGSKSPECEDVALALASEATAGSESSEENPNEKGEKAGKGANTIRGECLSKSWANGSRWISHKAALPGHHLQEAVSFLLHRSSCDW